MSISDDARKVWEAEQQRLRHVINALAIATPADVVAEAQRQVQRRGPLPEYREPYPGEYRDRHAEFVSSRLRLVTEMRREATRRDLAVTDREYWLSLWSTK